MNTNNFLKSSRFPPKVSDSLASEASVLLDNKIVVGSRVEHSRFGLGRVTAIEGSGENTKACVTFNNCGEKVLLLKFARLKVVS